MVFSSLAFICVFLPATFLVCLAVPGLRVKNLLLALASLVFYAYGEPVYVLLMLASTVCNWAFGMLVARPRRSAKPMLALAVTANLLFLGVFKYAGMAVSTINSLLGIDLPVPDIALPIGISFYTFQAMSYVIDAYRGEVAAQRSYLKVLLYIAFFPQLIAGPIVKYHDVSQQLDERTVTLEGVASGFRRFCVGLAKKVLIANTMGIAVDSVFSAPLGEVNIAVAWIGAVAYLFQIYFDFSGYSDMAIGLARMFGFHYKENFDHPYTSFTVQEFWRRWHISLSTWFKEYLYIPLGGSRCSLPRTCLNKLVVFVLCGLWHGAAWTFVVWGLVHGFFLILEMFLPIRRLPKALGWAYTMLVITFAFVIFRAETFEQGLRFMSQMVTGFHFEAQSNSLALQQMTPLFIVTLLAAAVSASPIQQLVLSKAQGQGASAVLDRLGYALAFVLFGLSFLALASGGYNPFIYFRF